MPELPEVETIKTALATALTGQKITHVTQNRADLRFPLPAHFKKQLQNRTITGFERRGKYMWANLDNHTSWIIHLGMSGRFTIAPGPSNEKHAHIIIGTDQHIFASYIDPRRFGAMDITADPATHKWLINMGVEPLGNDLTPAYLVQKFKNKKSPIKSTLMDQRIIAGLGNIYVCEALYRAGITPTRATGKVTTAEIKKLCPAIKNILNEAIKSGGSSLKDYRHPNDKLGYFQHHFDVYDREGEHCRRHKTKIQKITQSGRSSFFCPSCQT